MQLGPDALAPPTFELDKYKLDIIKDSTYLGFINRLRKTSLLTAISARDLGKQRQQWLSHKPHLGKQQTNCVRKKMVVCNTCVLSKLLYDSNITRTTPARQGRRLNTFQLHGIRYISGITWQNWVTNAQTILQAGLFSVYFAQATKCALVWSCAAHEHRMHSERRSQYWTNQL